MADARVTVESGITDFGDQTIKNVTKIHLKEIVSDDATSVSIDLGDDAGDDFKVDTSKLVVEGDTGRVGIGTATPSSTVEIEGSSGDLILEIDNNVAGSANFQIQSGAGNARADLVMNDGTASTTLTMKGQMVGIMDTSPSYGLDVNGTARVVGAVTLDSTLGMGTATPRRTLDVLDASNPQLRLTHTDNTEYAEIQTQSNADTAITMNGTAGGMLYVRGAANYTYLQIQNANTTHTDGTDNGLSVGCNLKSGTIKMRDGGSTLSLGCGDIEAVRIDASKNATFVYNLSADGNVTLGDADTDAHTLNGTLNLNSALDDLTCSGTTASFVAGETVNRGDVCYFKTDGKMWKALASAAASSRAVAIAAEDITGAATGRYLLRGFIKDAATFPTFSTVGGAIYTNDTAGPPTQTAPSDDGDFVQVIGWAVDGDTVYFNPDTTVIEVA